MSSGERDKWVHGSRLFRGGSAWVGPAGCHLSDDIVLQLLGDADLDGAGPLLVHIADELLQRRVRQFVRCQSLLRLRHRRQHVADLLQRAVCGIQAPHQMLRPPAEGGGHQQARQGCRLQQVNKCAAEAFRQPQGSGTQASTAGGDVRTERRDLFARHNRPDKGAQVSAASCLHAVRAGAERAPVRTEARPADDCIHA